MRVSIGVRIHAMTQPNQSLINCNSSKNMCSTVDLGGNGYSHLPPKKRLTRDIALYPTVALAITPPKIHQLPFISAPDVRSLSPYSSASSDSGFGDVEPLDLSVNSTEPSLTKGKRIDVVEHEQNLRMKCLFELQKSLCLAPSNRAATSAEKCTSLARDTALTCDGTRVS